MRERLLRLDEAAREDEVLGLRRADEAGEPLGAAGPGDDAEQDLGLAEPRVVGRDAEVAGERDLAPAAEGVAGDGGHRRLGEAGQGPGEALEQHGVVDHVGVRHRLHLLDVGAGGEDLLATPEDDGRHVAALGGLAARGRSGRRWISPLRAFIGGRSRRMVPIPSSTSRRTRSLTADRPPVRRRRRSGRARAPAGATCARRTGSPGSTTCSIVLRSAPGVVRCSPMTTRVESAMPVLTQFMLRLSSLHVACRCSRSASRSSWICHWPKTRMISTSPSEQRTKSCWSLTRERDVAVVVDVGLEPEVDEHVEDPAAQRVLVRRRGEVRQRRGIGHGSNLTTH